MNRISATEASARICGAGEAGLIDLREAGQFGEAHALFAVPLPWSRAELAIGALVPRPDAPLILIDAGDGVAERAARRFAAMGYADLSVVEGGMPAWEAAGLPVYKGVNVPSKTLGELVEAVWHPTMIRPEDLAAWQRENRRFRFFDARPPAEYGKMRVPGSVCLPNGELAHRIAALPDADAPVVITCAGRTRGIVGAIGMRISGHDGPLYALENGTQGWALAGETLERGNTAAPYPELGPDALAASRAAADRVAARFGIPLVTTADFAAMRAEAGRTTYLFDTRSAPEVAADPVAAAVHAASGQIVQATDQWIGLRRARVVLCCDTGLRSAIAAFWLRQLGYDARILRIDADLRRLAAPPRPGPALPELPRIAAATALRRLHAGETLIDLRASAAYRQGHVAGARWACRPMLSEMIRRMRPSGVMLIAEDTGEAALAAADLHDLGLPRVGLVDGGVAAMIGCGAAREVTPNDPPDEARIDHLFFVHDRHDGNLDSSRRYLEWETGLVAQLSAEERAQFHLYPVA
ncbi:rhodanese [Aliigemmobacter aestuarii]|uniref:Rhodanese n=1 Tax=Aliigemmobacter aestuarii TaxID=1445661 RepID=A0A4S3MT72_9RHOB|nr:rhodanese-like domain-containing protein [Gemmobacter aestuarii]THD84691.1 rhodanese [Gemmobacter aestuarii]